MTPEADDLVGIAEVGAGHQLDALDDLGKVPEVEHVVALLRGGEEGLEDSFVEGEGGLHDGGAHVADGMFKLLLVQKTHIDSSFVFLVFLGDLLFYHKRGGGAKCHLCLSNFIKKKVSKIFLQE